MQTAEEVIRVHQCLHGYADGHQLIQTSTKIPPKADRLLLTLSDMSGPSMITGFQSYLTGYPLPDTGWYAFAKTWYASEMPRPGCVWTHTLLIETADLARVQDHRSLLKAFVRPSKVRKYKGYTLPIKLGLNLENHHDHIFDSTSRDVAVMVLKGLYQQPDKPVYLPASHADYYEDLVLKIWNQQYPKLRRSFWFCTGSLGNRRAIRRPFDLQVIPSSSLREIQREVPNGIFIELRSKFRLDAPQWVFTAADDLLSSTESKLRQFLLLFGADATEGREPFSQILDLYTKAYETKADSLRLSEVIRVVSTYYPEAQQGIRLKQVLLGGTAAAPKLAPNFWEIDLLRELAVTDHYAAFDANSLRLHERARELVYNQPIEFRYLILDLLNYKVNPLGEEMIAGMSEAVSPTMALDLAKQRNSLLFVLTKYNPSLLTTPQMWQESTDRQRELYDHVRPQLKSGELNVSNVVQAMLSAGSDVLAEEVIFQHGPTAVTAVLDWIETVPASQLSENWERAMTKWPTAILSWLESSQRPRCETMALLSSLLDPHSEQVLKFGTKLWLPLARANGSELTAKSRIRVMAFLLALGFNNPDACAPELVAEAFQTVHDAATHETLPYASWRLLMHQAPSLTWWGEWDKGERLRRALVDRFIRFKWNLDFFLQAIKREDTFIEVLRNCSGKKRFFRLVAHEIDQGYISASEERRRALFHSL